MRYTLAASTISAVVLLSSLSSAEPVAPRAVLENFFNRATSTLTEATDVTQAGEEVRALFRSQFDGRWAARHILASEWANRTAADRDEFSRMFSRVLAHAYLEIVRGWLPRDRPPTIRFLGEEAMGPHAARVRTSVQVRDGSDIPVDYLMARAGEGWSVRDVEINGISMLDNYRAQVTRVLRTSSYAELLARLRAMVGPDGAEPVASTPKSVARPDVVMTYFDPGRAELGGDARRALEEIVERLGADNQARVIVEGHTDQQGVSRLNEALADRRANAIREYLVSRGLGAHRISAVGFGARQPACREPVEPCWAHNRRAVVRVIP